MDTVTISKFERDLPFTAKTKRRIETAFGFRLDEPMIEAAFAILANDEAAVDQVKAALARLEAGNE